MPKPTTPITPQKIVRRRHPVTGCRVDSLMGHWLMDSIDLERFKSVVFQYDLKQIAEENRKIRQERAAESGEKKPIPYKLDKGVARLSINGPITKYQTSFQMLFGGTSTLALDRAIRHAMQNKDVKALAFYVDSPGGTFHGTGELADLIFKSSREKPFIMFCSGHACSGAYYLVSQGTYVASTPQTIIGSIGTKAVVMDTSEKMSKEGTKVIPIIAGKFKADATPGTKITPEQIARIQGEVDKINNVFVNAVIRGRPNLKEKDVRGYEAGIFLGDESVSKGLVEEACDEDRAAEIIQEAADNPDKFLRKVNATVPPQNDPQVAPKVGTDRPTGSRTMLDAKQLEQAKTLPGAASITAENADTVLLGVAVELAKRPSPPVTLPADVLASCVSIRHGEIDLLQKQEKILPDQAAHLKSLITKDTVGTDGSAVVKMGDVLKAFDLNKPGGLTQEVTGAQPATRTEPSNEPKETDADKQAKAGREQAANWQKAEQERRGFVTSNNGNGR